MNETLVVLLSSMGLLGAAFAIRQFWNSRSGSTTTPVSKYTDAELGTLPQVPGLMALEKKEPGLIRAFLITMKESGVTDMPPGAGYLGADIYGPDREAALIAEETGWRPEAGNPNGGAAGLMQWIPKKAGDDMTFIGIRTSDIRKMTGIEQVRGPVKETLRLVGPTGRADPPMAGWGNSHMSPDDTVIARKDDPKTGKQYAANYKAYDPENKGYITSGDVRKKVYSMLDYAKGKPRVDANGKEVA